MTSRTPLVLLLTLAVFSCGDDRDPEMAQTPCEPGAAAVCTCDDASPGSQICSANGQRFSECVCFDATAANNGAPNNGAPNNGPPNNGAANNGPANNGAANNGAANNGAGNNGGPEACTENEACAACGGADRCICAPNPGSPGTFQCVPACETDEDCPEGREGTALVCDTDQGFCVLSR